MHTPVTIYPVTGLPEVKPGDNLAELLLRALQAQGLPLEDQDVLVVAQKVVSKAEGNRVPLADIEPSPRARDWAERWERDARMVELVLRESRRIVRMERGLIITETRHGFICANAGIDLSNSGEDEMAVLLPEDSDRSARRLREDIRERCGRDVAVIVADSFGRPWRSGLTQVALGLAGLEPLADLRGEPDADGRPLHVTIIALADELASAADLVCGKINRVPMGIVRGFTGKRGEGSGQDLLRDADQDLFR
ncbi:MAG: coenzyme F420-0:L-glutamate ligase [SAR324 cluster bacterium]|nr:coenzyme F420-0:L-glutamate ligase [SAR324 cluster bacterium]MCZ6728940.1 coenzyme F420-0:L-glutamate ligase [SAR324 cluster bacterium]